MIIRKHDRTGQRVRITEGHGDANGATGTIIRRGYPQQFWIKLDAEWAHLRTNGLTWAWDGQFEVVK